MLDGVHAATVYRTRIPKLPLSAALRWSISLSVLLTVVLITLLSIRMSAGADPVLGPKIVRQSKQAAASQTTQQTQSMLPSVGSDSVAVPDDESQPAAPVQQVPAPVTQTPVAPVVQTPVAPVQTSTS